MSRRNKSIKRPIPADPRYDSQTVSKFLNALMNEGKKSLAERLAAELILASKGEGSTIKKKEDTHRMAEANRAFAHYRW